MEVHKHPHHVTHKKKFGEYLLEFFMLFLAVFLGFIAENVREQIVEKKNTKEYIEAYRNDLERNQKAICNIDSGYMKLLPVYDSISSIYYTHRENTALKTLDTLLGAGKRNVLPQVSVPAYAQLLNSGSLKYIHNSSLRDSMAAYYDLLNELRDYDLRTSQIRNIIYPEVLKLEDLHAFWRVDQVNQFGNQIPDMDRFEPLSSEQPRILVAYYRQYFIQLGSDHRILTQSLHLNKSLMQMIDQDQEGS